MKKKNTIKSQNTDKESEAKYRLQYIHIHSKLTAYSFSIKLSRLGFE